MGRKNKVAEGKKETTVCPICYLTIAPQAARTALGDKVVHASCPSKIIYRAQERIFKLLDDLPKKFCLQWWAEEIKQKLSRIKNLKSLEEILWSIGDDLLSFLRANLKCRLKKILSVMIESLGRLAENLIFWKPAWAL